MTNVRQVKLFPAVDKAAEARALLEGHVKANPLNERTMLAQAVVGQLPAFVLTSIFEDIGALEKNRDALWTDSTFLDFQSKLNPLLRQATEVTISETIVRTTGGFSSSPRYSHQARFFPSNGEIGSVGNILEEFAKGQQADGRSNFRMARVLFSATGPIFTLGDSFESLTEYDNVSKARGEKVQEALSRVASITRAPMAQELREVIVPFGQ